MILLQAEAILEQADSLRERLDPRGIDWGELLDWEGLIRTGVRVAFILLLAWAAFRLLRSLLVRIERSVTVGSGATVSIQEQRVRTLLGLVRSVGVVVIVVITTFMILGAFGVNIAPLLAGAGVVGLAVSFGAQSLVKDVISGLFILIENQFGVGDVIRVGDASGSVERMSLRIVVLRDVQGSVHIIPNGEITRVTNMTRAFSRAVLDVGVAYKEDADRVMEVLRDIGRELVADPQWGAFLVEEIKVPGIESFGESSINIRVMATTVPMKQWDVARELRRRIKRRFDEEGIEIPFPHRTVEFFPAPSARPAEARGEGEG